MSLQILVIDDERPALDELAFLLGRDPRVTAVLTAGSAAEALAVLQEHPVDAVFTDIAMPGLTGLDLALALSRRPTPPAVVFVTAHDEHAVAAFDLDAVDYVLKPVRDDRLAEAVRRVVDAAGAGVGDDEERSRSSSAASPASWPAARCSTPRRRATTRGCTRPPAATCSAPR